MAGGANQGPDPAIRRAAAMAIAGASQNHSLGEPFNSGGMSYLGQAVLRNPSARVAFSSKSEIFRDEYRVRRNLAGTRPVVVLRFQLPGSEFRGRLPRGPPRDRAPGRAT